MLAWKAVGAIGVVLIDVLAMARAWYHAITEGSKSLL